jgi:hypothetical protein
MELGFLKLGPAVSLGDELVKESVRKIVKASLHALSP